MARGGPEGCSDNVNGNSDGRAKIIRQCVCVYLCLNQGVIQTYLQGDPCNDIKRVNDVAQRLAHLPPVSIPHHSVQINLTRTYKNKMAHYRALQHLCGVLLWQVVVLAASIALTSLNGSLPVSLRPIITMRATQKNKMSWPVSSRVPGQKTFRSSVWREQTRKNTTVSKS